MKINLQIERLILDGIQIAPHEHPVLQAAVENELARLLRVEGLRSSSMSGGAAPEAKGGAIQTTNDRNPAHLGMQIARAAHRGLTSHFFNSTLKEGR